MIPLLLILLPLAGAALAAIWPSDRMRPWFLPAIAAPHTVLAWVLMVHPPEVTDGEWFGFDAVARAVLPVVSLLFLICSAYGVPYLRVRGERPNRVFVSTLLAVSGLMSAGLMARHLGVLWIATEGVTLAAVPLLHFNRTPRAFEATWKYLLVGGTGIALSLLGSFCLGYASLQGNGSGDLTFHALAHQGATLSRPWLLIAWVLLLVGYGTKMGLAPMHTWKPDAYGEAPGLVGAILAGGVTTVAFVALLRVRSVLGAAGEGPLADLTLLSIGLFSVVVASLFLLGTRDFKRMLAYSSVEHMGILSVGAALGAPGIGAALFHVWTNSLTKGSLFLSAGNLRRSAGSASMDDVRGLTRIAPRSTRLFVAGLFAVTACPPFGIFFSELRILRAAFDGGHAVVTALFLLGLLFAFFGLARVVLGVAYGPPRSRTATPRVHFSESAGVILPPLLLLALSAWMGLYPPALLESIWSAAVAQLVALP
ncbi:MAG: proton-conducting transporter membrane subunit [Opitutaceae bacterium]